MGTKAMQRPILQVPGLHASAGAVLVHQQIERDHAAVARLAETRWIRVVANREAGAYERPGTKPTPIQENAPTAVPVGGLDHHEILENASRRRG
jgi:hypothetical protein